MNRITTTYQYEVYRQQVQNAQASYFSAQQQVTTGKRWQQASEDPLAANQVLSAQNIMSTFEQSNKNLTSANDYLKNNESVLSSTSSLLQSANQIAIAGASSAVDAVGQTAMANQIADLQKQLVNLANTRGSSGQYLYAGQNTGVQPFTAKPPILTYSGDSLPVNVEVQPGNKMQVNVPGADGTFLKIYDTLETLKNNLLSGNVQQLSTTSIAQLKTVSDQINQARGDNGVKLQNVKSYQSDNQRRIDDMTINISNAQDVDMASAMTNYQQAQVSYQAALQVAGTGMKLSLMDYIR